MLCTWGNVVLEPLAGGAAPLSREGEFKGTGGRGEFPRLDRRPLGEQRGDQPGGETVPAADAVYNPYLVAAAAPGAPCRGVVQGRAPAVLVGREHIASG